MPTLQLNTRNTKNTFKKVSEPRGPLFFGLGGFAAGCLFCLGIYLIGSTLGLLPAAFPFSLPVTGISTTPTLLGTPLPGLSPAAQSTLPAIPEGEEALCISRGTLRQAALVTRVVDGDTVRVSLPDGTQAIVRYVGMDTPERGQPFYGPATDRNRELVEQKSVLLVQDVSETDRFGRLLRYVIAGDTFVNHALVAEGYASAVTFPPDVACEASLRQAERDARASGAGLWAEMAATVTFPTTSSAISPTEIEATQDASTPPPQDTPPPNPTQPEGNCDPAYPTVCIPPPPPDLDCADIPHRRFQVLPPDPHRFDGDFNGIGCER